MPRKPPKPRTPRTDSAFKQFQREWESKRADPDRGALNWLVEPTGLEVAPGKLMATLRALADITQEHEPFDAARAAVIGHALVDVRGKWKRHAILASPLAKEVCERIEEVIAAGTPERLALAEATVELNVAAVSFDAAVQRLRRLVLEYRKSV